MLNCEYPLTIFLEDLGYKGVKLTACLNILS